ncbi:hypothetical protein Sjap_017183 [Stephania japonica]|uniref:Uncharacterized protein n=1 Tax=Stephania japonica TaxID=461633 RepID=A0AAP0I5P8_9MAGN
MASNNQFKLALFATALFLSSIEVSIAARRLLDTPVPSAPVLPTLPTPTLPQLPATPPLPKPTLPQLPTPQAPSLPTIPTAPKMTLPPLPSIPLPTLPMPTLPNFPTNPAIPQLTLPPLSSIPLTISNPRNSTVKPATHINPITIIPISKAASLSMACNQQYCLLFITILITFPSMINQSLIHAILTRHHLADAPKNSVSTVITSKSISNTSPKFTFAPNSLDSFN